jgi:putative endonuclease
VFVGKDEHNRPTLWTLDNWRTSVLDRSVAALDRLSRTRGHAQNRPAHLVTGERGELAAYFFLRRSGFTVVARRWNDSPLPGDLDLIAWEGDVLCFVEVKTRTSLGLAPAEAAVDEHKRRTLRRLARHYMRQLPAGQTPQTRFDIVTVYEPPGEKAESRLIASAFGWAEQSWGEQSRSPLSWPV